MLLLGDWLARLLKMRALRGARWLRAHAGPRGARARTRAGQWPGPGGAGVAPVRIGL